jgi:hypothetical protein
MVRPVSANPRRRSDTLGSWCLIESPLTRIEWEDFPVFGKLASPSALF